MAAAKPVSSIAIEARVKFGRFEIDSVRRVLLFDGQVVPLQNRAFDVLDFLASHHDRFVSRDEIEASVWRGLAISANNLTVQMSSLRRTLVDYGAGEVILTRLGVGYRFIGSTVDDGQVPDDPVAGASDMGGRTARRPPAWRAILLAAFCVLVLAAAGAAGWQLFAPAAPPRLSLVVLPFRFLGGGASEAWLADAVTDDLTTELARVPDSTVIARETAEVYRAHAMRADEIGRELNVRYLIEGSVAQEANTLHINVQLIDTVTNDQIWASDFDVPRDQMSGARDLIVGRIATALNFELVQAESSHTARDRPNDTDAVDLYFRARSVLDREATLAEYQSAQALLAQAVAQQPGFGDALAELGWLLAAKMTEVDDPLIEADHAEAKSVIARALQASPNNPLALAAQGRLYSIDGRYTEAVACAKKALALEPNSADAQLVLAYAEYYEGHLDAAVAPLQATLRLNPEGPSSKLRYMRLGFIRLLQGQEAEAIELLQKASAGDTDPEPGAGAFGREEKTRLLLIAANELNGDETTARGLYAAYNKAWLNRTVWRIGALSPKSVTALPYFSRFLDALRKAGMPQYTDEHVDAHVDPSFVPLQGDIFAATPLNVPGARTIDTAGMQALVRGITPKLIIDVGTGSAAIDGAVWQDTVDKPAGDNHFLDDASRPFATVHPLAPIVVMGDGAYDVTSYNAALHLAAAGHRNVLWYRGGEEAWARLGLPSTYRRSD